MATKKSTINPGTDENVVNLDFTGLEPRSGGKAAKGPAGDYLLQLVGAKNVAIKDQAGRRQIASQWRVVGSPNYAEAKAIIGDTVYQNLQVMPDSKGLWFTRNVIEDLVGKEVTGKAFALVLDAHFSKLMGATLGDGNEYTNKDGELVTRSEIKYPFPASRFIGFNPSAGGAGGAAEQPDEEDEAPAPKAAANGKARKPAAEAVAEEVASSDDEEEIEVQELENI